MSRLDEFRAYSLESIRIGDVDPGKRMLRYLCDRYELNLEQRYWIAWLAAMTYCGASAFYVYNEFPDYENVDVGRMQRWWDARGREQILCQTDRRWVRSSSQFVPAFETYRAMLGGKAQHEFFMEITHDDYGEQLTPQAASDAVMRAASQMYSFGQFALFIYTEFLHCVTPLELCPTDLDLDKAWSCRFGLYYAYDKDSWITDEQSPILSHQRFETETAWDDLRALAKTWEPEPNVWELETLLCAYRKWHRGKRYVGFYLDREAGEITKMQQKVTRGVCWDVLWQYRAESYGEDVRAEHHGHTRDKGLGVTKDWQEYRVKKTQEVLEEA